MKPVYLFSSMLVSLLAISAPMPVFAHVGHGDEFQSEGGINRVEVNPQNDSTLGIEVTPIAPAADGSSAVLIPATALVDADGKQLVFVQYENFYEPVPITTGATQGELIEVTKGLSVGEKLVNQGSLSLYAESRKTPTADAASPSADAVAPTHAQADAQGLPHSHNAAGDIAQNPSEPEPSSGFPMGTLVAAGGGTVLAVGAIALVASNRKKKSSFSNKKGGF